ncbi:hypothetical protein [Cyanobium gracile]|uniref:Uncharacterized protein n=1 Tax=Cyanobium gracile (strain ATCC 27147 / PCC 6307) TaxID=292564 RepID=K9P857_CYAGP|nr:hypothetical protein [Cyanobium gracile]AFY29597.1 hypothetical protein Cyagr_2491 [Cyanobium gracile PCC 6307]
MNTKHDTVDVLLAVALEVAQALLVLIVAVVALLLTLARWRPSRAPAVPAPAATTDPRQVAAAGSTDAPPIPLLHPLALVAEQLEALPVARLRPLAGVSSKRHRKHELVAQLVAC